MKKKYFFFKSTDKEKINTKCIIRFNNMYVMLYIRSCFINWLNLFNKEYMNSLKRIVTNKGGPPAISPLIKLDRPALICPPKKLLHLLTA